MRIGQGTSFVIQRETATVVMCMSLGIFLYIGEVAEKYIRKKLTEGNIWDKQATVN